MKRFFLMLMFIVSTQSTWAQDSTAFVGNEQIYIRKNHYRITFPSNWKRNLEDVEQVIYMGPPIDSGYFKSDGSFGINVNTIPNGYTTKDAMKLALKQIEGEKMFSNYKIAEQKSILIHNKTFEYIIFQVEANGIVFTSLQFYLVDKNRFYILGGTLPAPSLGKYREIYFNIAKTFVLEAGDCSNEQIIDKIFLGLDVKKSNDALMKELKARPDIVYNGKIKEEVPGVGANSTFTDFIFTKHSFVENIEKGIIQFQGASLGEKQALAIYFYFEKEDDSNKMYELISKEMMKGCFEVEDASAEFGSYKETTNIYEDESYLITVSKNSNKGSFSVDVILNKK